MSDPAPTADLPRAGLVRRLAAILYDSLLLVSILFLATAVALPVTGEVHGTSPLLTSWLFLVAFAFFAWFWIHGGQTLGMRAWRLRVRGRDGGPITPWQALLRYLVAIVSWLPFGLGFLWSLWDRDRLTWHDRYSMTEIVVLPKPAKGGK